MRNLNGLIVQRFSVIFQRGEGGGREIERDSKENKLLDVHVPEGKQRC